MRMLLPAILCLAVILNSIELGLQSEHSFDEGHFSGRSQSPAQSTARSRSRSPPLRKIFPGVLGFKFEDLEYIRLSPYINMNRTFELRRYVFPPNKPIRLRRSNFGQRAMPTSEQIVLTTSDGDVCAILDKTPNKHTILRPILTLAPGRYNRAKININSGEVEAMTEEEMKECPISTNDPVSKSYAVSRSSSRPSPSPTASSSALSETPFSGRSESPALSETFPNVFGYEFKDLAFIRLIPHNSSHRIFRLAIYAFPPDKPIKLRTNNRILIPVPTGNQIVLASSKNHACAMLLKSSARCTSLRPILTSILGVVERVKINMSGGAVKRMTTEEIAECPGTAGEPITRSYRVYRV